MKLWVAFGGAPFWAVIVMGYVPSVPSAGVPASVAVPSPLSENVTPLGNDPLSIRLGGGRPLVLTENVPAVPTTNVVLLSLVIAGGVPVTVSVLRPEPPA